LPFFESAVLLSTLFVAVAAVVAVAVAATVVVVFVGLSTFHVGLW